jgi:hypothetical protein
VDFAVRDARDRLAHQPAPAGRDDADRPGGGALQHLRAAGVASIGA